jgi:D-alanine-D-alanine ligase-like ATP-grasp enzyme
MSDRRRQSSRPKQHRLDRLRASPAVPAPSRSSATSAWTAAGACCTSPRLSRRRPTSRACCSWNIPANATSPFTYATPTLSVPRQQPAASREDNSAFLAECESIVVKPARGEQGRGISVAVREATDLETAIAQASQVDDTVLLEEFVAGQDLRIIVIDFHVVAAALRRPPRVRGTLHDVTEIVGLTLVEAAVRATRALDIPVVGMDFIVPDPAGSQYWVIEANERPGLANHEPQPIAERFVDLLFPQTMPTHLRGLQQSHH